MRYHLNLINSTGYVADSEGIDLPSLDHAREAALDNIRSIVSEEARRGILDLSGRVEIACSTGETLSVIPYPDAFEIIEEVRSS